MKITTKVMAEVSRITLNWSRRFQYLFPLWEVLELRNEAFLVSIKLLEGDNYKPELSSLTTFLWHALRYDVGHRYKRANAQRYLTCPDGVRRYQQKELSNCNLSEAQRYEIEKKNTHDDIPLTLIDVTVNHNDWADAKLQGYTDKELLRRGMDKKEQRKQAVEFKRWHEQQSKR